MMLGQFPLWFYAVDVSDFCWKLCLFVNEKKRGHDTPRGMTEEKV